MMSDSSARHGGRLPPTLSSLVRSGISIIVAIGLLAFIARRAAWDGIVSLLDSISAVQLIFAIILFMLVLALDILRPLYFLHPPALVDRNRRSLAAACIAPLGNTLLPTRAGDLALLVSTRSSPLRFAQRSNRLILLRAIDALLLLTVAILTLSGHIDMRLGLAALGVLGAISILLVWRGEALFSSLARRVGIEAEHIRAASHSSAHRVWFGMLLLSSLAWAGHVLYTWMLAAALGLDTPYWMMAGIVCVATLTKVIPLTPGGAGVYEAALAILMETVAGVEASSAAAFALIEGSSRYLLTCLPSAATAMLLLRGEGITAFELLRHGDLPPSLCVSEDE
jgi:uncharacterized membrane protein YbhN (UPF0104 family)